jgi:hypothetical protein
MAKSSHKGQFMPKNPEKVFGSKNIIYRSSWEFTLMRYLDSRPEVVAWSSEGVSIPYRNPLTGRHTVYIPDFLVIYQDKSGKNKVEMIEVKPAKEVPGLLNESKKLTKKDMMAQALNMAKWQAAMAFCKKRGIHFRIMTEMELFPTTSRGKKR